MAGYITRLWYKDGTLDRVEVQVGRGYEKFWSNTVRFRNTDPLAVTRVGHGSYVEVHRFWFFGSLITVLN
ncbi:MAG: hypothetical protein A3H52_00285 [Candidatus Zambryskibacteria bacterium RIFCSPLOWO2_02_FULL_39_26]|uniref:Uncharacterized protein n=1 Tax=Candidatus Zambryskibacteria bacterium RIFCSPLOWO2_12_FULL_39_23 TaxID=1802776 RepID=A0A1G2US87_9BACT|nr:MAG: hypothetical protein A3H52_00285 [Candidatus Zambryskibacteria bacterium RIFCSPLOWO2_02_FULL_39_26]OHB12162.1 MAG: hypothetical protein A3G99_00815 [Candidatus Zambryskibacteria bacterium RIFCSPLOWO2_12_FULL_39_23]